VELNNVSADGIVDGRQASPLLELVTKVEAGVATFAGAATAIAVGGDFVVPADVEAEDVDLGALELGAVELGAVELGAVELGAVELAGAFDDVVLAELSEPQPPRAAKKETHTNPAHVFSASILKIIVTCPIAA
jgi:hypothetical protein